MSYPWWMQIEVRVVLGEKNRLILIGTHVAYANLTKRLNWDVRETLQCWHESFQHKWDVSFQIWSTFLPHKMRQGQSKVTLFKEPLVHCHQVPKINKTSQREAANLEKNNSGKFHKVLPKFSLLIKEKLDSFSQACNKEAVVERHSF